MANEGVVSLALCAFPPTFPRADAACRTTGFLLSLNFSPEQVLLGLVGAAQITEQVTEAPGGSGCQGGAPPHCLQPQEMQSLCLPLLPPYPICAVWHGKQVRERGREKKDLTRGKERNLTYFERVLGTELHSYPCSFHR